MDIERRMFLSANVKLELELWIRNVMTTKNVMSRGQPSCELKTDASNEGWGPVFGAQSTCGLWASDDSVITLTIHNC